MILGQINSLKEILLTNDIKYIFYSESLFYKNFYEEFYIKLKKKLKNREKILIVTSDFQELSFWKKKKVKCYCFKNNFLKIIFFAFVKCENLIMTMTDIGNNFPLSKRCRNYIYFFHSLASTHQIYTKSAFDNYNTIFVNGEYQLKEIKFNEKINNLKEKRLVKVGYFYLNYLRKKIKKKKLIKNTILFAPSWNYKKKNLFNDYGKKIINILLENDFKIIFRPHPEMFKRNKSEILNIKNEFKTTKNFSIDYRSSNLESLQKSEFIITDNSTIGIEFALVLKRNVIYIDYQKKIHNKNFFRFKKESLEEIFRRNIGTSIPISKLEKLGVILSNLKINRDYFIKLNNFEKKYFYNEKKAINKAIDFLLNK